MAQQVDGFAVVLSPAATLFFCGTGDKYEKLPTQSVEQVKLQRNFKRQAISAWRSK